jgi:deazaflavin-dependent oxidoreductase (nitroreductase family)
LPHDIAQRVVDEFRSGTFAEHLESGRVVLVTVTAHDTGEPRTVPVRLVLDGSRRTLVLVTPDEARQAPAWYQDILADPWVTMENGAFTIEATAEVLGDADRDAVLARAVEAEPELAGRGGRSRSWRSIRSGGGPAAPRGAKTSS